MTKTNIIERTLIESVSVEMIEMFAENGVVININDGKISEVYNIWGSKLLIK